MTKAETAILLNRSLTAAEDTNFNLYLKIATERLEQLLCLSLSCEAEERTYESRLNYRTVYVDPFSEINSVTIDGEEITDTAYTIKQNDKFNGSWYNIIEFDTKRQAENIVVDAEWGFDPMPSDLKLLLAKLFAQGSVEQTADNTVKSKKIEDFTVTYKDGATYDEFVSSNSVTIEKYSQCNTGALRHGYLRPIYNY